jgi:positive phototaxis protein PixI
MVSEELAIAPEGALEAATPAGTLDAATPGGPSEHPEAAAPEAQFLQIYLDGDRSFLLPVAALVEIMKVPIAQVVPMFQMAPWVMGVYNCRGDVLWVVDLNHLLGLSPWYEQDNPTTRHTVVVIKAPPSADRWARDNRPTLGLVVSQVEGMVACPLESIEPPEAGSADPRLTPLLSGVWSAPAGTVHLILDSAAILRAAADLDP